MKEQYGFGVIGIFAVIAVLAAIVSGVSYLADKRLPEVKEGVNLLEPLGEARDVIEKVNEQNRNISDELSGLNQPTHGGAGGNTTQVVPAPGFEDVQEMIVVGEDGVIESAPEPLPSLTRVAEVVTWNNTQNGWEPSAPPPRCEEPLRLRAPTDLSRATSVLYPGQFRGGNYKPHGGFRFDTSRSNEITIVAPLDARVVDGGRYLADGEIQYTFDLITPCGIWYRLGHLRELSPKFAAIAETFPEAVEGDSRTYGVSGATVTEGEIIATAVGFMEDENVFMDWGVYDLRSKNSASEDSAWALQHPNDQEQHAVCWFDLLSPADETIVRSLPPADGVSGATSDYCI